jgi:nucleoside-specific outer membrane channel protein Tsx
LKPERWGSQLVQENYQEERACDKRHNNNNNNNNNIVKLEEEHWYEHLLESVETCHEER